MHIQIVNFNLQGINEDQYRSSCEAVAPSFAAMPGLVAKFWLADAATNTYGGVYVWRERADCDAYKSSAIFQQVLTRPEFANASSRDFGILEGPSEITRALSYAKSPMNSAIA